MNNKKVSLHPLQEDELPKEWKLLPVGKVLIDTQYGTNAPSIETGGTAVVGMKDIQDGSVLTTSLSLADLSDEERSKYLLEKGDVLINRTNSYDLVGKAGIYNSDVKAAFASYLVRLKADINQILPEYLNFWLNGYIAQKTIKRIATRAVSQANINPTEFKKHCHIPLPPKDEQDKIVSVLRAHDDAVEITEHLIAAKKKHFEWLITKLLNDNENGKNWRKVKFDQIFSSFKEVNTGNEHHEVLSVTKDGIVSQSEYFNKDVASEDKSKYLIVRRGCLVMSGLNFWMGSIDFQNIRDSGIVSPAYKTFQLKSNEFDIDYLRFFVRSHYMRKILKGASVQGASIVRRNLDRDMLMNSIINIPDIESQKHIASILNTAKNEIELLQRLNCQYRKQKRGLMQKLLTGEWRVNTDKEVA